MCAVATQPSFFLLNLEKSRPLARSESHVEVLIVTDNLQASRELRSIRVGRRRLIPRARLERFTKRDHATSAHSQKVGAR